MVPSTIGEGAHQELSANAFVSHVMRVRHMSMSIEEHTSAIRIACSVANGTHLFGLASSVNVRTFRHTFESDPFKSVPTPLNLALEVLTAFDTKGVAIFVPVPTHPLVSMPSVHH